MKKTFMFLVAATVMYACSNQEETVVEEPIVEEVVEIEEPTPTEEELIMSETQANADELTSIEQELDSLLNN